MKKEKYERLVRRLENSSDANNVFYRLRVIGFAGIGYAFIYASLIFALFCVGWSIWMMFAGHFSIGKLKLLLFTLPIAYYIIKSLFLKRGSLQGIELTPKDAPALFQDLEELRLKMNAPKMDRVLLDHQFNAYVMQYQKVSFLTKQENILVLGIPLLTALNRDQVKSILVHELAHVSNQDTRIGAWLYKVHASWGKLMYELENNDIDGTALFRTFIKWYYPRFYAYSHVLRRQEEYLADAFAAKVTSVEVTSQALVQVHVKGDYYHNTFLPNCLEKAKEQNLPFPTFLRSFLSDINSLDIKELQLQYESALQEITSPFQTHPSLTDRVKALGGSLELKVGDQSGAIQVYLKNHEEWLNRYEELILHGFNGHIENFAEHVEESKEAKQRYAQLQAIPDSEKTVDEHYQFAKITNYLYGPYEMIAVCENIISLLPLKDHAQAYYFLVETYLELGELEKAIECCNQAGKANWEYKSPSLEAIRDYLDRDDDLIDLYFEYDKKVDEWDEILEAFDEEFNDFSWENKLRSHNMDSEVLNQLREAYSKLPWLEELYLMEMVSTIIPERQGFVIGFTTGALYDDTDSYAEKINTLTESILDDNEWQILSIEDEEELAIARSFKNSLVFSRLADMYKSS